MLLEQRSIAPQTFHLLQSGFNSFSSLQTFSFIPLIFTFTSHTLPSSPGRKGRLLFSPCCSKCHFTRNQEGKKEKKGKKRGSEYGAQISLITEENLNTHEKNEWVGWLKTVCIKAHPSDVHQHMWTLETQNPSICKL